MTTLPNSPAIDPDKLDKLAQVAVHVGLGLEAGQDLVMTAALIIAIVVALIPILLVVWIWLRRRPIAPSRLT